MQDDRTLTIQSSYSVNMPSKLQPAPGIDLILTLQVVRQLTASPRYPRIDRCNEYARREAGPRYKSNEERSALSGNLPEGRKCTFKSQHYFEMS